MIKDNRQENNNEFLEEMNKNIQEENKRTMNQDRRYYRHNSSLDYLEEQKVILVHNRTERSIGESQALNNQLDFLELIHEPKLYKALKKLNDIDIKILERRYRKKMLFKEIADELDLTIDNAKKRHSRVLKRLKKHIKG